MLVKSVSTRNTPISAAIAASHRSCCRSSPADRWKRWTSPITAAIDKPASPIPAAQTTSSSMPCSEGTPSGFFTWVAVVTSMVPGHSPNEHGPDGRVRSEERDAHECERLTGERVIQRREDHRDDEEPPAEADQQPDRRPRAAGFRSSRPIHEVDACTPANRRKGG